MKARIFIHLLLLILIPLFANAGSTESSKNSCLLSAQIGINAYTATEDPIERFPHSGIGMEFGLGDHFGIGGSVFYSKWSDYLRQYGGKYSFQVFRPSLDFIYHFTLSKESEKNVDLFSGASLAYNFTRVENELGNEYQGDLSSHISVSPFIGCHFSLFEKASGIFKKIFFSVKCYWTINGDFSGLYGMAGLTLAIK